MVFDLITKSKIRYLQLRNLEKQLIDINKNKNPRNAIGKTYQIPWVRKIRKLNY